MRARDGGTERISALFSKDHTQHLIHTLQCRVNVEYYMYMYSYTCTCPSYTSLWVGVNIIHVCKRLQNVHTYEAVSSYVHSSLLQTGDR